MIKLIQNHFHSCHLHLPTRIIEPGSVVVFMCERGLAKLIYPACQQSNEGLHVIVFHGL